MNTLEDRRPVAATTTASDNPNVIGEDLAHLLVANPDLELASIRLIPNDDGTVGIAGRIGHLAPIGCPQCHQPIGRPHTEFCTLAPDRVWPEGHHLVHSEAFIDQDDPRGPKPASGSPCYVERPDGTTAAATQCIDPDCRYPNPHTHPDLIAEP